MQETLNASKEAKKILKRTVMKKPQRTGGDACAKTEVLSDWRRSVNTKPGETVDSLTEHNIWRPAVPVLQRLAGFSGICSLQ